MEAIKYKSGDIQENSIEPRFPKPAPMASTFDSELKDTWINLYKTIILKYFIS